MLVWYGELTTRRNLTRRGLGFLGAGIFWLLVFLVLPGLVLILVSFITRGGYGELVWDFTIENYKRFIGFSVFGWTADYVIILWRSVWVAFMSTLICVILSYPLAFFICSRPEKKTLLLADLDHRSVLDQHGHTHLCLVVDSGSRNAPGQVGVIYEADTVG